MKTCSFKENLHHIISRRTKPSSRSSRHSSHNATFWPPCRRLTIFFRNLSRKRKPLLYCQNLVLRNLHPKNVPYTRLWLTHPIYLVRLSVVKRITKITNGRSPRRAILGNLVIVSLITWHSGRCLLHVSIGRKTEEGWSVYKEDELGLNNKGGGKC